MTTRGNQLRPRDDPDLATAIQYRLVEKLADSERRHRELLAELPHIVLRLDDEGMLLYVNDTWARTLGHDIASVLGKPLLSFVVEEDRDRLWSSIMPPGESCTVRFQDDRGSVHWMQAHLHRLESGEIVGSLEDVTIRRELEAGLLRGQRLESIGRLAGGLAHDFNNLLTVILGNMELAQRRLVQENIDLEELHYAKRACDHATSLTKQMLTFSKGGEPVREVGSLGTLVREAIDLSLRGSNVRSVLHIDDHAPLVDMDASQMHQVINNIIINAEQAMPRGGTLRVRVREQLVPGGGTNGRPGVALEIRDSGCGIPQEHLDNIFEPYFSTKENGTGLGLTSAYWIVKRHDGVLQIESEPGAGTIVRVLLPAAMATAQVQDVARDEDDGLSSPSAHVLLMDDDDAVRLALRCMLEALGHRVVTVCDGAECALAYEAAMRTDPFDLVILDLTIVGGHDGLWTINRLREIDPSDRLRSIVVSGYSNGPVMADHTAYGFDALLQKPFELSDLQLKITTALNRKPSLPGLMQKKSC